MIKTLITWCHSASNHKDTTSR